MSHKMKRIKDIREPDDIVVEFREESHWTEKKASIREEGRIPSHERRQLAGSQKRLLAGRLQIKKTKMLELG